MSVESLTNKLALTNTGKQAVLDAKAGGILVKPKSFALGDYNQGLADSSVPESLQGNPITGGTGKIFYVEVINDTLVRVTIDLGADVGTTTGEFIGEILLYSEDGSPIAYALIDPQYKKFKGEGLRIDVVMHLTDGDGGVFDVTLSEHGSVPSVASVADLPDPLTANVNAISVLNLISASDGDTPGLAVKFGEGGQHWGFFGLDRVFSGTLGAGNATSTIEFTKPTIVEAHSLEAGEKFVVQVVSGDGVGYTRKFELEGEDADAKFVCTDETGFPELSDSSVVSIWRQPRTASLEAAACPWPPNIDGIPKDWILSRGSVCPEWVPPTTASKANLTKLHVLPSKLKVRPITMTSNSETMRYELENLKPKNGNYVLLGLQGARQHRTAFEVWENYLEFSEQLPNNLSMDVRVFTQEESTGTKMRFAVKHFVSDGQTTRLPIGVSINSPAEALVIASGVQQAINAYIFDPETLDIVLTSPLPAVNAIEVYAMRYEQVEGFSTQIRSANYVIQETTGVIELPFTPEGKDQLLVSRSGLHVHKDQMSLVGNKLAFTSDITPCVLEVIYFQNVKTEGSVYTDLPGVVTDVIPTPKGFQIIRHNELPIRLNMPAVQLKSGEGIRVDGEFPVYKISSLVAEQAEKDQVTTYNIQEVGDNTVEIVATQRVKFKGDISIQATADFFAALGEGFTSESGRERIQFVLGFKTPSQETVEYGRGIKGTGEQGFSSVDPEDSSQTAYANANITQSWNIVKANHPAGAIDIVAKLRVTDASLNNYDSKLTAGLNVLVIPKIG